MHTGRYPATRGSWARSGLAGITRRRPPPLDAIAGAPRLDPHGRQRPPRASSRTPLRLPAGEADPTNLDALFLRATPDARAGNLDLQPWRPRLLLPTYFATSSSSGLPEPLPINDVSCRAFPLCLPLDLHPLAAVLALAVLR